MGPLSARATPSFACAAECASRHRGAVGSQTGHAFFPVFTTASSALIFRRFNPSNRRSLRLSTKTTPASPMLVGHQKGTDSQ